MTYSEQIDQIMDNFDFSRVKKTMDALNWRWFDVGGDIPSESEIRSAARQMMKQTVERKVTTLSTGGFEVTCEHGLLSLRFVVEYWDCMDSEDSSTDGYGF